MNAAVKKEEIESILSDRFGHIFERHERPLAETLSTGIAAIDDVLHGFPRGAITECHGESSSGRTSLLVSGLAGATAQEENCALIDCHNTFDVASATDAGVDFNRLLWVRCHHNLEHAFKAVDLILHAGGFGFVALNLCDVPRPAVRRIVSSWWFRFRRAIENTPTALVVLTRVSALRSCAALALELKNEQAWWPSTLSLAERNQNDRLTVKSKRNGYLSLVQPVSPEAYVHPRQSHTHFLQAIQIRIDPRRSVERHTGTIKFQPQRHRAPACDVR